METGIRRDAETRERRDWCGVLPDYGGQHGIYSIYSIYSYQQKIMDHRDALYYSLKDSE